MEKISDWEIVALEYFKYRVGWENVVLENCPSIVKNNLIGKMSFGKGSSWENVVRKNVRLRKSQVENLSL